MYQHERVVGSRTKVLFDNQDIFSLNNFVENQIVWIGDIQELTLTSWHPHSSRPQHTNTHTHTHTCSLRFSICFQCAKEALEAKQTYCGSWERRHLPRQAPGDLIGIKLKRAEPNSHFSSKLHFREKPALNYQPLHQTAACTVFLPSELVLVKDFLESYFNQ